MGDGYMLLYFLAVGVVALGWQGLKALGEASAVDERRRAIEDSGVHGTARWGTIEDAAALDAIDAD